MPDTLAGALASPIESERGVEPKRILFVDDEPHLLDGLRDAFRPYRRRWEMRFVSSGEDALGAIAEQQFDVIVSDLRMPAMDGATLLELAKEASPSAVRIVLSGHAELRVVARAAGVAHQLLAKPCETDQLAGVIDRACAIQEMIARVEVTRLAAGVSVLPSAPQVHMELSDAVASGDASVEEIARIIERDMAIAAKVLQLANSAYFGRGEPISGVGEAVIYLGLDAVQALVLHADTFRQLKLETPIAGFDIDRLGVHCCRVGQLARLLVEGAEPSPAAFTAGLLHDVGLLVGAMHRPEFLGQLIARAREERCTLFAVERAWVQITHAEVGAYVLALWGLPFTVTAAVGRHPDPPVHDELDEAAATYIANTLIGELEASSDPEALPVAELDLDYVSRCGLTDQLPRWRELAAAEVEAT